MGAAGAPGRILIRTPEHRLGPDFRRLWWAYTFSAAGSAVATDAFALIAVLALSASAMQVSLLAALGGAIGALLALPLGPWIDLRRKRPLMVGVDLLRCCALVSVPVAHVAGVLTYPHLLVVGVLVAVGQIIFVGASGAHLKSMVARDRLTEANGRFESVLWISMAAGPPVGGLLVSLLGPAATFVVNAVGYLLSALGVRSIAVAEPEPPRSPPGRSWSRGLSAGWRHIWSDGVLAPLFVNTVAVNSLITAVAPLLAVLMLRDLGLSPLQYGLSLGVPCLAGVVGARLSRRLSARHGDRTVVLVAGVARVLWIPVLPFVGSGWLGLAAITAVHSGTVFFMGVFNPVVAAHRLRRTPGDRLARVQIAWSVGNNAVRAGCVLAWGLLATVTTVRTAIAVAVVLLLVSCACLPWKDRSVPPGEPGRLNGRDRKGGPRQPLDQGAPNPPNPPNPPTRRAGGQATRTGS